jgi:hypothetical protein
MQEAKEKLTEIQKRVSQHQQTVAALDTTINEVKIKYGRIGKVKTTNFHSKKNSIFII